LLAGRSLSSCQAVVRRSVWRLPRLAGRGWLVQPAQHWAGRHDSRRGHGLCGHPGGAPTTPASSGQPGWLGKGASIVTLSRVSAWRTFRILSSRRRLREPRSRRQQQCRARLAADLSASDLHVTVAWQALPSSAAPVRWVRPRTFCCPGPAALNEAPDISLVQCRGVVRNVGGWSAGFEDSFLARFASFC